ncbi:MAG: hypothetical protein WAL83_16035 [Arenicellales bacterium]
MRLVITTPVSIVVDEDNVRYVRGEDATGDFGIEPGHAEFITALEISVLSWRDSAGAEHHAAVRGGVLSVSGDTVDVATRQAVGEDTLERLDRAILERFREEAREEEEEWMSAARLHVAMVRQLQRYLDAGHPATSARRNPYNPSVEGDAG